MRPIVESAEARLRVRAEFPHRGKAREAAAPRHGVVTDWIRRMLLSGTDGPSAAKVAYRHAELAGQMPTVYSDDSPQVQRNKLWHFDGAAGLDDARKRAFRSAQRMGSAWYRMNQLNWHGPPDGGLQVRPEDWNSVAATLDKEVVESRRADN